MILDKKPKCSFCQEVLDDRFYWWLSNQRGKGGKLVHTICAQKQRDTLETVLKGLERLGEQINNERI